MSQTTFLYRERSKVSCRARSAQSVKPAPVAPQPRLVTFQGSVLSSVLSAPRTQGMSGFVHR